tara:strand:+ start:1645 stop:2091 length:447 start_codon:yes stop_codon:yes gene_type:complete
MNIQNLINHDIKQAMLAKDVEKLAALRSVKSAFLLEASKDGRSEISDEIALKIIVKLVKQRKDSAQIYNEQNRQDLEKDELEQLKHLEVYLPKQLSEDEIKIIIDSIVDDLGAKSMKDMGRVMSEANKKIGSQADGKLIANIVRNKLQ